MDAIYPLARDLLSFSKHAKMGLKPHTVKELCFTTFDPDNTNSFVNIGDTIDLKMRALAEHKSQISDTPSMEKRVREWASKIGEKFGCKYAEGFVRIKFER